ncbi:MAG: hypothetical protein HWE26_06680 [Alteromonadaceae bacterium]|nr:hypothetical protein [Alteromonadaceae bacterium]
MKRSSYILASLMLFTCHFSQATTTDEELMQNENKVLQGFIKRQVKQSISVGRAVGAITSHYPNEVETIVATALDMYPDDFKEIIHAAISAQPNATSKIVKIAIDKDVASCPSIVELAIQADPSYVDFVVGAAANSNPDELKDIVRVAVLTEPDSADTIVQTLTSEHPNELVDILTSAMQAVPVVGEYVVNALLAVFPHEAEAVVTTAVRESAQQREQLSKIIETAHQAGLNSTDIKRYAMEGGMTEEEYTAVINQDE